MATLYVRKEGSDANNGTTVALAKLTIVSAESAGTSGDTINIGEGGYLTDIGNVAKNYTYQGAGMDKTTIVGRLDRCNF